MSKPTDNEFSRRIKTIFMRFANAETNKWKLWDLTIEKFAFTFGVLTKDFDGGISVVQSATGEDFFIVAYCTYEEGQTDNAKEFSAMMNSRAKEIHANDFMRHITTIVLKPIGQRAPECANVPQMATA